MKWQRKPEKVEPELYSFREVKKFAWLPTKAYKNNLAYTVWLEVYEQRQLYGVVMSRYSILNYVTRKWVADKNFIIGEL